jgi:hypothetical protein
MSLAFAESEYSQDGPQLEVWQQPVGRLAVFANLPLRPDERLDLAVEDNVAMVNDQAVLLTPHQHHILDVLLHNRYRYLTTGNILTIAAYEDETKLVKAQMSNYVGELAAKLRVGDRQFLGRVKTLKGHEWAYRVTPQVVYTGTIKESEHSPQRPSLLEVKDFYWREKQNCKDASIAEMVPEAPAEERRAVQKYCASCAVKASCLTDALLRDDHYGVRGAATGPERQRMLIVRKAREAGFAEAQTMQLMAGRDTETARVVVHKKPKRK